MLLAVMVLGIFFSWLCRQCHIPLNARLGLTITAAARINPNTGTERSIMAQKPYNQPLGGNEMPRFAGIASMFRLPTQVSAKDLDIALPNLFTSQITDIKLTLIK